MAGEAAGRRLLRPLDDRRDHVRGGRERGRSTVVLYGDYLCPYCRSLVPVFQRLRQTLGDRLAYAYRHFPNERIHPGATLLAIGAEAAGRQGRFYEMHDALYAHEPPIDRAKLLEIARSIGLDIQRFERDLADPKLARRVEEDYAEGRRNHVTATPTIFVDGSRYDGAWDFYSMLEGIDRPVGARVRRTARAFANLPASAGIALLIAAGAALVLANSPLAGLYQAFVGARFGVGPLPGGGLSLSVGEWCSEGLLAIFFLILGLEIRREAREGSFADWRAAAAPALAAAAGAAAAALAYLVLNRGAAQAGWPVPIDTGIPFSLGILALCGSRASSSLKLFVAAFGVVDDLLTMVILALVHPRGIEVPWLVAAAGAIALMAVINRWRVYAAWPYVLATIGLWLTLHQAGVGGALSGIALAAFLPPRPVPKPAPLLAQAANALAELELAERELKRAGEEARLDREPLWDWASRNLSAAADRLLSPAERTERAVEPWSSYAALPLFAFTAAGVSLTADLGGRVALHVFLGVALALALAKPAGIVAAVWLAEWARVARPPADAGRLGFVAAALLCGIGDPLSLLLAEQAFGGGALAAAAKIGVLAGSALAALLGAATLALSPRPGTAA
ncbi:MAG TPA: Na+/H+ antiporter NhaA [Caulobacteraceae bacterium]|nr:Na+/H+ antiporter NhaA [Caulobacteraceae bacterium]